MSKKLAIAMFGQKRLSREGGVEIVVKELCTRMAQNGCDVTCYNRAGHHVSGAEYDDAGKTEYEGIRQKSVPTIERRGLAAVSSSAFAALYSAFGKYDVVHIHAEGSAFFAWLPKMFGKRVVVTVHGIDWQREKWQSGLGSKFIHQGEKNAAKYADEVIVLSKGVQDYFKETYGRKTHFIPNGVNRPQIREAKLIKDHFGLEKDSYILFLGRLVPEKGIRYLVEAFKNVKTDKKLVIHIPVFLLGDFTVFPVLIKRLLVACYLCQLRSDSTTYGKWYGVTLSAENKKQFLIPEGFAHGFLVLSNEAEFCYKVNDFWHPNDEGGMAWNDPEIGIEWPQLKGEYKGSASAEGYTLEDGTALNLSDKDQKWLGLKEELIKEIVEKKKAYAPLKEESRRLEIASDNVYSIFRKTNEMKSDLAWKREWEAKVREKARQEQARQEQRERQPKRKKRSYDMSL